MNVGKMVAISLIADAIDYLGDNAEVDNLIDVIMRLSKELSPIEKDSLATILEEKQS